MTCEFNGSARQRSMPSILRSISITLEHETYNRITLYTVTQIYADQINTKQIICLLY